MARSLRSHDLARNLGVFVKRVHRAEAMVTVGDNDLAVRLVAHLEDLRELPAVADFLLILLHMLVAHAEQRESRGAEDILRLEARERRAEQLFDELGSGL